MLSPKSKSKMEKNWRNKFIKFIARLVGLLQKFEIRFITYLLFIDFNFIIPKGTFFFQKIKSKNNYLGYFEI